MSNTPKMDKNFSEAAQTSEPQGVVVPTVVEETAQGRASYDIFSRVLKDRIITANTCIHHALQPEAR